MALYKAYPMKMVTKVPYDHMNRPIINRIPPHYLVAIIDEINNRINAVCNTPNELITAGWIPGNDWTGTVWEPIYFAAKMDHDRAGMVFGALVFEAIMNRPEDWSFGKYQVDGRNIGSNTYFRIYP